MAGLPEGFVLESTAAQGLPEGFVLEQPQAEQAITEPSAIDSIKSGLTAAGRNIASGVADIFTDPTAGVRNAAGVADAAYTPEQQQFVGQEMTAINRIPMDLIDSLPNAVNAGLNMAGSDSRVPTMRNALAPYGVGTDRLPEGAARTMANLIGTGVTMAGAAVPVAQRNLASAPGALAEFAGFGTASSPAATARNIASTIDSPMPAASQADAALPIPKGRIEKAAARDAAVRRGAGQAVAAGYKLDDLGEIVSDAAQKKAISAGIDKPIVAQVAASSKTDKGQIGKMLNIVKQSLQNKTFGDFNLPRQVLGDSVYGRYQAVRAVNREAGKDVNAAVKLLKNSPIDGAAFDAGPVRNFAEALNEVGIKVSRSGKISYRGSDFEGTPQARKILTQTFERMYDTDVSTLADAHRLKKFIDNMADEYGKSSKGLSGNADRIVKNLRHDVNQFIREYGPEQYAKANDTFSETVEVLGEVDRLIGRNNNPSASNLAKTARKALSNYQTGDQVMKMLDDLDTLAVKYGSRFDDDIKTQMSVVQSIEKMFPSSKPPASFGGEIDKSLDVARRAAGQSTGTTFADLAVMAGKKAFGKTPTEKQEALLTALEELIASGQK